MFLQNEYEMSRYNLDEADIEEQRARFALFENEVGICLPWGGGPQQRGLQQRGLQQRGPQQGGPAQGGPPQGAPQQGVLSSGVLSRGGRGCARAGRVVGDGGSPPLAFVS